MSAIAEVQALRRSSAAIGGPPRHPIGAAPLAYVDGKPTPEPPAQSHLRAELHWAEVARLAEKGKLTNRHLAAAYLHSVMAEDDPAKLRDLLVRLGAWAMDYADQLDPTLSPRRPVPAPR